MEEASFPSPLPPARESEQNTKYLAMVLSFCACLLNLLQPQVTSIVFRVNRRSIQGTSMIPARLDTLERPSLVRHGVPPCPAPGHGRRSEHSVDKYESMRRNVSRQRCSQMSLTLTLTLTLMDCDGTPTCSQVVAITNPNHEAFRTEWVLRNGLGS